MQQAMARQAEAERNRRARIINADGEFQAAARLSEAADVISPNPVTIQLRTLQTLAEISSNQGSTIVLPLPLEMLSSVASHARDGQAGPPPKATPPAMEEGEPDARRLEPGEAAPGDS
jgi:hypothetical protein